ncbi:MAG: InlB B-repeat-containing protein [Spirochaetaceae bacterium]|jgi:uncharacterized repeat protein (TIGR02543 family)|nr:InlB B-repeat-containing protein [Spirochaetaceae bacterium]
MKKDSKTGVLNMIKRPALWGVIAALVLSSCLQPYGLWQGKGEIQHTAGDSTEAAAGSETGMVWKGILSAPPSDPESGWVFYDTTRDAAYVFDGADWVLLTPTVDKTITAFVWKGNHANHAAFIDLDTAEISWAYYNETDAAAYIYTGQTGEGQFSSPYAGWDLLSATGVYFLVSFDTGGGSYIAPFLAAAGAKAPAPSGAPARPGYAFNGWFTGADGAVPYNWETVVTGPLILYAGWTLVDEWALNLQDFGTDTPPVIFNISSGAEWLEAIGKINETNPDSGYFSQYYVLRLKRGIVLPGLKSLKPSGGNPGEDQFTPRRYITRRHVKVSVRGETGYETISLDPADNGSLLLITNNVTMTLRNVSLRGHANNINRRLARVGYTIPSDAPSSGPPPLPYYGGKLILRGNSSMSGNRSRTVAAPGAPNPYYPDLPAIPVTDGAVYVYYLGVFEMWDNTSIYGNYAGTNNGTGVICQGGLVVKNYNASIYNNISNKHGTAVYFGWNYYPGSTSVRVGSTFIMNDNASIHHNYGISGVDCSGTVTIENKSIAIMNGNARIYNNFATMFGGGVYIAGALIPQPGWPAPVPHIDYDAPSYLIMNDNASIDSNRSKDGGGIAIGRNGYLLMNGGVIYGWDNGHAYGALVKGNWSDAILSTRESGSAIRTARNDSNVSWQLARHGNVLYRKSDGTYDRIYFVTQDYVNATVSVYNGQLYENNVPVERLWRAQEGQDYYPLSQETENPLPSLPPALPTGQWWSMPGTNPGED